MRTLLAFRRWRYIFRSMRIDIYHRVDVYHHGAGGNDSGAILTAIEGIMAKVDELQTAVGDLTREVSELKAAAQVNNTNTATAIAQLVTAKEAAEAARDAIQAILDSERTADAAEELGLGAVLTSVNEAVTGVDEVGKALEAANAPPPPPPPPPPPTP